LTRLTGLAAADQAVLWRPTFSHSYPDAASREASRKRDRKPRL